MPGPIRGVKLPAVPDRTQRVAPKSLFRGGRPGVCRGCHKPTGKRAQWHPACVDLYRAMRNPVELRRLVLLRDNGVCAACGLNCYNVEWVLNHWRKHKVRALRKLVPRFHFDAGVHDERVTFWDADHFRPVSEGGGLSALLNIKTLCYWCHKRKTHGGERRTGREVEERVLDPLIVESAHMLHDAKRRGVIK